MDCPKHFEQHKKWLLIKKFCFQLQKKFENHRNQHLKATIIDDFYLDIQTFHTQLKNLGCILSIWIFLSSLSHVWLPNVFSNLYQIWKSVDTVYTWWHHGALFHELRLYDVSNKTNCIALLHIFHMSLWYGPVSYDPLIFLQSVVSDGTLHIHIWHYYIRPVLLLC